MKNVLHRPVTLSLLKASFWIHMLNLMLISPLLLFVVVDDVCTVPRVMLNIGIQDGGYHHKNVIKFDRGAPSEFGAHFIPLARAPTILYPGLYVIMDPIFRYTT